MDFARLVWPGDVGWVLEPAVSHWPRIVCPALLVLEGGFRQEACRSENDQVDTRELRPDGHLCHRTRNDQVVSLSWLRNTSYSVQFRSVI